MEQVLSCILCCLQTTGGRSDSWYVPGTSITTLVPKCSIACPHHVIFRTTKHIWWNLLLLFSQKVVSDSLWPHGPQHTVLYLLDFAQTHVHWASGAIEPSHPLSSPPPLALSPSQHQSLLHWVSFSHQWLKDWSFSFSISPKESVNKEISFFIIFYYFYYFLYLLGTPLSCAHLDASQLSPASQASLNVPP